MACRARLAASYKVLQPARPPQILPLFRMTHTGRDGKFCDRK